MESFSETLNVAFVLDLILVCIIQPLKENDKLCSFSQMTQHIKSCLSNPEKTISTRPRAIRARRVSEFRRPKGNSLVQVHANDLHGPWVIATIRVLT